MDTVFDFDRPTPLKDGERGLDSWLRQFFQTDLAPLPEEEQDEILRSTEKSLKSALWDGTCWTLDYRRLRAVAVNGETTIRHTQFLKRHINELEKYDIIVFCKED